MEIIINGNILSKFEFSMLIAIIIYLSIYVISGIFTVIIFGSLFIEELKWKIKDMIDERRPN